MCKIIFTTKHFFNKYSLSIYCVLGTLLGPGDRAWDQVTALMALT